jgi:hypothetical protein
MRQNAVGDRVCEHMTFEGSTRRGAVCFSAKYSASWFSGRAGASAAAPDILQRI